MIKLFEQALEAVRVRPAGIQDEIARILLQLSGSNAGSGAAGPACPDHRFQGRWQSIGAGEGIPPVPPFRLDIV